MTTAQSEKIYRRNVAWGRGIRRIVDICRDAGNPAPTWRLDTGGDGLWVESPFSGTY